MEMGLFLQRLVKLLSIGSVAIVIFVSALVGLFYINDVLRKYLEGGKK